MDIFNLSISIKIFPDDLKVLKVAPVYKSGERENLNNYRPIAVLPTIARVFNKLLYRQLYSYLMNSKSLDDRQFGFRSLHSTALALGKSTDYWLMNIDNGKLNSSIFLGIRKAFDTVNHDILLQKLECYGIKRNELIFFQSYLKNRIQTCNSAVLRQGSDSIFWKSRYFLFKQGFLCLVAMKFCRVVKTINTQLLVKKNLQILLRSSTEHAPKSLICN